MYQTYHHFLIPAWEPRDRATAMMAMIKKFGWKRQVFSAKRSNSIKNPAITVIKAFHKLRCYRVWMKETQLSLKS